MPRAFPLIRISEEVAELLADVDAAYARLAAASHVDREEVDAAYGALSKRKQELYTYIQMVEALTTISRTRVFRFE